MPSTSKPVYILNGPNLNLLGQREPAIYGTETLADVRQLCQTKANGLALSIRFHQSNHEGALVDWIQEARTEGSGIIINAAAYTHTSIAIADALRAVEAPIIEVHLSNVFKREPVRHQSFVAEVATATMAGFGPMGYELALEAMAKLLSIPASSS